MSYFQGSFQRSFQGFTHRWPNEPDHHLTKDFKSDKNPIRVAAIPEQYSTRECRAMVTRGKPVLDCANETQLSLQREFCKSSHAASFQNKVPSASLEPFKQTYGALGCCYPLDLQFAFQTLADLYKTEVAAEITATYCTVCQADCTVSQVNSNLEQGGKSPSHFQLYSISNKTKWKGQFLPHFPTSLNISILMFILSEV